jgi:hypothetical protein
MAAGSPPDEIRRRPGRDLIDAVLENLTRARR